MRLLSGSTMPLWLRAALVLVPALAGCAAGGRGAPAPDPRQAEIALPALAGWNASLVLDQGRTGIWTVGVLKVFPYYGCPEIVGLDDLGRLHALWSYSGKWTPVTTIADGKWLGGIALADVDPRIDGPELYTGSQQGNLYQVVAHENTQLDHRLIGRLPGLEIHTVVAADLDPARAGQELVIFTSPGRLVLARPRADGKDGFELETVEQLPGRVRDALVLPARAGQGAEIATIGRHGRLEILRWKDGKPNWETVFETAMGLGRVARRDTGPGGALVLYSTADDGLIRRHERAGDGRWVHELVYVGPPGPRGIASGRFDADATLETIAVFGYSEEVELLTRRSTGWQAETIFVDRDKGHWLATGEVDGRNGTDELVGSGYGGRIVLLSRPPGFGLAAAGAAVRKSVRTD